MIVPDSNESEKNGLTELKMVIRKFMLEQCKIRHFKLELINVKLVKTEAWRVLEQCPRLDI